MLVRIDNQQPWNGEPLDDVRYPTNIEQLWSDADLNAIGLAKVQRFEAPSGQSCAGEPWYVIENGIAVEHYNTVQTPPPNSISHRQFYHALAHTSVLSNEEAIAAVTTRAVPAALQAALSGLPAESQFDTSMLLRGASTFERDHPTTVMLAQLMGWSDEAVDTLFRYAASL